MSMPGKAVNAQRPHVPRRKDAEEPVLVLWPLRVEGVVSGNAQLCDATTPLVFLSVDS